MAALELYVAQGFERTTVAEIAARAEFTERTFFRYFADKREVLFSGAQHLQDLLVTAVADAPAASAPLEVVARALDVAGALLEERREGAQLRYSVIEANPELKERGLIKMASLAAAMADALRRRGVGEPAASLSAEAGVAVFRVAFERWVTQPGSADLPAVIHDSLRELRVVTSSPPSQ